MNLMDFPLCGSQPAVRRVVAPSGDARDLSAIKGQIELELRALRDIEVIRRCHLQVGRKRHDIE